MVHKWPITRSTAWGAAGLSPFAFFVSIPDYLCTIDSSRPTREIHCGRKRKDLMLQKGPSSSELHSFVLSLDDVLKEAFLSLYIYDREYRTEGTNFYLARNASLNIPAHTHRSTRPFTRQTSPHVDTSPKAWTLLGRLLSRLTIDITHTLRH